MIFSFNGVCNVLSLNYMSRDAQRAYKIATLLSLPCFAWGIVLYSTTVMLDPYELY